MRRFDSAVNWPKIPPNPKAIYNFFNMISSYLPRRCFEEEGYIPEIVASFA